LAANYTGGDGGLWSNPDNWSTSAVPPSSENVYVQPNTVDPFAVNISSGTDAVCNNLYLGKKSPWESTATLDVQEGSSLTIGSYLEVIGPAATGRGTLMVSGGSVSVMNSQNTAIGKWGGRGQLHITDGSMSTLKIWVAGGAGSNGHIQLDGGELSVSDFMFYNDDDQTATMDIAGGRFVVRQTSSIYMDNLMANINAGYITGSGVAGNLRVYNDPDTGWLTAEVPEPSTIVLLTLGGLFFRKFKK
jgi:T5SS/PEP-CTERM-associated repeat protein